VNTQNTRKTAIFVDGGFYRARATSLWGVKEPIERAEELYTYCLKHISESDEPRDLYRIFYYDCPPMSKKLYHPLTHQQVNFSELPKYQWAVDFHKSLLSMRKVAMRMGELAESQAKFIIKDKSMKRLISGQLSADSLAETDFTLDVKQKGVDMRVGLDAASLAFGKYVDQIVLIAGDSDFIPVAKMSRRNGIDFILDPMQNHIKPSLLEHIDGIETF
jgi:uncharacterized LabA/DUF88 family protein